MEWMVARLDQLGVDVNTVDFGRIDYKAVESGYLRYEPFARCLVCHGNGLIKFEGQFDQNNKTAECFCADITICGLCRGAGEVVTDGVDADGNIEQGVDVRECLCRKIAREKNSMDSQE